MFENSPRGRFSIFFRSSGFLTRTDTDLPYRSWGMQDALVLGFFIFLLSDNTLSGDESLIGYSGSYLANGLILLYCLQLVQQICDKSHEKKPIPSER